MSAVLSYIPIQSIVHVGRAHRIVLHTPIDLPEGAFENFERKEENAGDLHFLLFSKCLQPCLRQIPIFITFILFKILEIGLLLEKKVCRR